MLPKPLEDAELDKLTDAVKCPIHNLESPFEVCGQSGHSGPSHSGASSWNHYRCPKGCLLIVSWHSQFNYCCNHDHHYMHLDEWDNHVRVLR